jgi:hypothetical protein
MDPGSHPWFVIPGWREIQVDRRRCGCPIRPFEALTPHQSWIGLMSMETSIRAGPNMVSNPPILRGEECRPIKLCKCGKPARPNQRYCRDCHAAKTLAYRQKRSELESARLAPLQPHSQPPTTWTSRAKKKPKPLPKSYRHPARLRTLRITLRSHSEDRMQAEARAYLNQYLSRGLILRGVCEVCGSSRTRPYHADYAKPLDVMWLCWQHRFEHDTRRQSLPVASPSVPSHGLMVRGEWKAAADEHAG